MVGLFRELIAESHLLKRLYRSLAALGFVDARERERKLDVCEHGLVRTEVIRLENEAYRVVSVRIPVAVGEFLGRAAVNDKVAVGVLVKTAYDVEHSRLAASGVAEDSNEFAFAKLKVDAFERVHSFVAYGVVLRDAFKFEHWRFSHKIK